MELSESGHFSCTYSVLVLSLPLLMCWWQLLSENCLVIRIFDDVRREQAKYLYDYSFSEHTLRVTDIATGYGGCNAIIVSASEDRTCKV